MTDFLLSKLEGGQPRSIANADLARFGESRKASREDRDLQIAEFNAEFNRLRAEAEASFSPRPVKKRNKDGSIEIVPESESSYDKFLDWADSQIQFKDNAAFITKKAARGIVADPSTLVGAAAGGLASDRTWTEGVVEAGQNADELVRLPDNAVQRLYQAKYQRWQQQKNVDLGASKELAILESERRSAMQGRDPNPERIAAIDAEIEALRNDGHSSSSWLEFASKNKIAVAGDIVQETAQEVGSYATGKAAGVVARPLAGAAKLAVPARATAATQRLTAVAEATVAKLPPSVAARTKAIATPVIETTKASAVETAEGYAGTYESKKAELTMEYKRQGMDEATARAKASADAAQIAGVDAAANILSEALMSAKSVERLLRGQTKGRVAVTKTALGETGSEILAATGSTTGENLIRGRDLTENLLDNVQQGAVVGFGSGTAIAGGAKAVEAYGDYKTGADVLGKIDAENPTVEQPSAAPEAPAAPSVQPGGTTASAGQPKQSAGIDPMEIVSAVGGVDMSPVISTAVSNAETDSSLNAPINVKSGAKQRTIDILNGALAKTQAGEPLTSSELNTIKMYSGKEAINDQDNPLNRAYKDAQALRDDDFQSDYVFGPKEKGITAKLKAATASESATTEQLDEANRLKEIMSTGRDEFIALQETAMQQKEAGDWAGLKRTRDLMRSKFSAAKFENAADAAISASTKPVSGQTAAPVQGASVDIDMSTVTPDSLSEDASRESKTADADIKDVRYLANKNLKKTNAKNATAAQKYAIGKQLRMMNEGERKIITKALQENNVILVEGGRGNGKNALLDSDGKIYLNVDNFAMRNFKIGELVSAAKDKAYSAVANFAGDASERLGNSKDIASKLRHEAKHKDNAKSGIPADAKDFAGLRDSVIKIYTSAEDMANMQNAKDKNFDLSSEETKKLQDYYDKIDDEQSAWAAEAVSYAASNKSFRKAYLAAAKKRGNYKKAVAVLNAFEKTKGTALDILNLINVPTTAGVERESKTYDDAVFEARARQDKARERKALTSAMDLADSMTPDEFKTDEAIIASTLYNKLYGGNSMTPQGVAGLGVLLEPALTGAVFEPAEYYNSIVAALSKVGKISDKPAAAASLRVLAEVKFIMQQAEKGKKHLGTAYNSMLTRYKNSPTFNEDVGGMLARITDLRLQFELDKSLTKHADPYYADLYFVLPSLISNSRTSAVFAGSFLAEATRGAGVDLEDIDNASYSAGIAVAKAIRKYNRSILEMAAGATNSAEVIVPKVAEKLTDRQIDQNELIKAFGGFLSNRFQETSIMQEADPMPLPSIERRTGAVADADEVDFSEGVVLEQRAEEYEPLDVDLSDYVMSDEFSAEDGEAVEEEQDVSEEEQALESPIDDVTTHSADQANVASGNDEALAESLDKYQQFFLAMDSIGESTTGLPIAPSRVDGSQLRAARRKMRGLLARIPGTMSKVVTTTLKDLLPTTALTAEEAVDAIRTVAEGILMNKRGGEMSLLTAVKKSAGSIEETYPGSDTANRLIGYADDIAEARASGNKLKLYELITSYTINARQIGESDFFFSTREYYQALAALNVLRAVESGKPAEEILESLKLATIQEQEVEGPGTKSTDLLPLPANKEEIQRNIAKALSTAKVQFAQIIDVLYKAKNSGQRAGEVLYNNGWGDLAVNEDGTLSIKDKGTDASNLVYVRLSDRQAGAILNPEKNKITGVDAKIHNLIAPHLAKKQEGKKTVYYIPMKTDTLVSLLPQGVEYSAATLPWLINTHFRLTPVDVTVDTKKGGKSSFKASLNYIQPMSDSLRFDSVLTAKGNPTYIETSKVAPNVSRGDTRHRAVIALKRAEQSLSMAIQAHEQLEDAKGVTTSQRDESQARVNRAFKKYNTLKDKVAMLSTSRELISAEDYNNGMEKDLLEEILSGYHKFSDSNVYTYTDKHGNTMDVELDGRARDRVRSYFGAAAYTGREDGASIQEVDIIDYSERNKSRSVAVDPDDYFAKRSYEKTQVIPQEFDQTVNELFGVGRDLSTGLMNELEQVNKEKAAFDEVIADEESRAEPSHLKLTTYKSARRDLVARAVELQRQLAPISGELAYILSDYTLADFSDYADTAGYSKASARMKIMLNRIGQKPRINNTTISQISRAIPMLSVIVPFDLATTDEVRQEYKQQVSNALNNGVILAIPKTSYMSYLSGVSWAESAFINRDDVDVVVDKGIVFVRKKSDLNLPGAPTLADVLSFKFTNAKTELENITQGQKEATLYHLARIKEKQRGMLPSPLQKFMKRANRLNFKIEDLFNAMIHGVATGRYTSGTLKRASMDAVRSTVQSLGSIGNVYGVVVGDKVMARFASIKIGDKDYSFDLKDTGQWFSEGSNPIVIMRKYIAATRDSIAAEHASAQARIAVIDTVISDEKNEVVRNKLKADNTGKLKKLGARMAELEAAKSSLGAIEAELDRNAHNAMRSYLKGLNKKDADGNPTYSPEYVDRMLEYGIPSRGATTPDVSKYEYQKPARSMLPASKLTVVDFGTPRPEPTLDTALTYEEAFEQEFGRPMTKEEKKGKHKEIADEVGARMAENSIIAKMLSDEVKKGNIKSIYDLSDSPSSSAAESAAMRASIWSAVTGYRADNIREIERKQVTSRFGYLTAVDETKLTPRESKSIAKQKRGILAGMKRLFSFENLSAVVMADQAASAIREAESIKTSYVMQAQSDAEVLSDLVNSTYPNDPDTAANLLRDIADGMTVSISSEYYTEMAGLLEQAISDEYGAGGIAILNLAKGMRARLHELNVKIVDTLTNTPGLAYGKATADLIDMMNNSFSDYLTRSYTAHHLKSGEIWKKKISAGLTNIMGGTEGIAFLSQEGQDLAESAVDALLADPYLFAGFQERGDFSREAAAHFLHRWVNNAIADAQKDVGSVYNTLTLEGRSGLDERKLNGPEYAPFRKLLGEVEGLGGRLVASTLTLSSINAAASSIAQLVDMGIAIPTYSKQYDPAKYFTLSEAFASKFGGLFDQVAIPLHLKGQFQQFYDESQDAAGARVLKTIFGSVKAYQVLTSAGVWAASVVAQLAHFTRAGAVGLQHGTVMANASRTLKVMTLVAKKAATGDLLRLPPKSHPLYQDYLILASSGMLDSWASITDIKVSLLNYSKHESDVKKVLEGKFTENDAVSILSRGYNGTVRNLYMHILERMGTMFSALELPLKIFTQLCYIDMIESAAGKPMGREGWAKAGQMVIRDIPSQANVPSVITRRLEPYGISQYAGFFFRTFAAITYAPIQNAIAMKKMGVPNSTISMYYSGVVASGVLGMGGLAYGIAFIINLLVEAGAPEDEEELKKWRASRQLALDVERLKSPDGELVALSVNPDGTVKVLDLSFLTSFYNQPYALAKSTIRHINGEATESFFDDVVMKQMPVGALGQALALLFARPAAEVATGEKTLSKSMKIDDITDVVSYRGIGGTYKAYEKTGDWYVFLGVRTKDVNMVYEMNQFAATSVGISKGIAEDISATVEKDPNVRYTVDDVKSKYGYAMNAARQRALLADRLVDYFAEYSGLDRGSSEFSEKYAPGKADMALAKLAESGASSFIATNYAKASSGMSDSEAVRGAFNVARNNNALISDDQIMHNLRQSQIAFREATFTAPMVRAKSVKFGDVLDGDTLMAEIDGTWYEVRLDGFDTAEKGTPLVDNVDYYEKATQRLRDLTRGPRVRQELEYRVDKDGNIDFDDRGRVVARGYANGVNIASQMVKEGLAYGDSDKIPVFKHPALIKDTME